MLGELVIGLGMLGAASAARKRLSLPPLFKWPGGRARHAQEIADQFPKHDTYIEPFAGGASVFFRTEVVPTMVLGDIEKWNIKFFDDARKGKLRGCTTGFKVTRKKFEEAKKKNDPCSKMFLSLTSYDGNRQTFGSKGLVGKTVGTTKLKNLEEYEEKLRKAHLRIGSFETTMKKFDKPSAVHFLDPPWPTDSQYEEKWYAKGEKNKKKVARGDRRAFDPEYVMGVASKMKGYVYVVYSDHPKVRAAYAKARKCGWKTKTETITSGAQAAGSKEMKVLVAIKPAGKLKCSLRKKAAA